MKPRGPGRPPLGAKARKKQQNIRFTAHEMRLLEQRAKAAGMAVADYLRERGLAS